MSCTKSGFPKKKFNAIGSWLWTLMNRSLCKAKPSPSTCKTCLKRCPKLCCPGECLGRMDTLFNPQTYGLLLHGGNLSFISKHVSMRKMCWAIASVWHECAIRWDGKCMQALSQDEEFFRMEHRSKTVSMRTPSISPFFSIITLIFQKIIICRSKSNGTEAKGGSRRSNSTKRKKNSWIRRKTVWFCLQCRGPEKYSVKWVGSYASFRLAWFLWGGIRPKPGRAIQCNSNYPCRAIVVSMHNLRVVVDTILLMCGLSSITLATDQFPTHWQVVCVTWHPVHLQRNERHPQLRASETTKSRIACAPRNFVWTPVKTPNFWSSSNKCTKVQRVCAKTTFAYKNRSANTTRQCRSDSIGTSQTSRVQSLAWPNWVARRNEFFRKVLVWQDCDAR